MKKLLQRLPHTFSPSPLLFLLLGLLWCVATPSFGAVKTSVTSGAWGSITWSPAGLPIAGDDIIINTNVTSGPASALSFASFTVNTGFTFTHSNNAITVAGNLVVDGFYQLTNVALTVNGTTTINGTINDNNSGATNRFDGLVTINTGGTFNCSNNPLYEFRNGIANDGTCNLSGTGAKTFSTSSQSLSGSAAISLNTVTINNGVTLSNTNTSTATFSGVTTLNGTYDDTDDGGSNVFSGTLTIAATGVLTSANNSSFTFSGTGGIGNAGSVNLTGTGAILFSAAQTVSGAGSITLPNMTVSTGTLTWSNSGTLTVNGTSTLNSTLSVTATAGNRIFVGQQTVAATGALGCASAAAFQYRGGIVNNNTFTISSATSSVTFSTNNQALSGNNLAIANITVNDIVLTNNGTLTISTACTGTTPGSNITQGTSANLTYSGAASLMAVGSLTATASGNTVTFAGTSPNIRSTTGYFNLSMTGTGSRTLFQNLDVANNLTVGSGLTFQASTYNVNTVNLSVSGDFSKNGAGSVTVTGLTTISGTGRFFNMTGNPSMEFQGGITQNSSAASNVGTGTVVFSVNSQDINGGGAGSITFGGNVILNDAISVTSIKSVTITGTLDAALTGSAWINGSGSSLTLTSNTLPFVTTGTLNASAATNLVTYNGTTLNVFSTTYHNLTIAGSNTTKTVPDITVNGNLSHTNGTLVCTGTQTFGSSTFATIAVNGGSLNNMVVNKTGSTLTMSSNLTISTSLTVNAGSLVFGPTARNLTVNGDLSGASGTLDMTGNAGHNMTLAGANSSIGTLSTVTGNLITYNRAGDQSLIASTNYRLLNLSGSGTKSLSGNTTVVDTLRLTADLLLSLGSSNLTLAPGSRIRASASGTAVGLFGVNRKIQTDGTGVLIKEGTTTAHFSSFAWSSSAKNAGHFPVGTSGFYNLYNLTSLTATVGGTGTISVRAVALKQPNVPYYNNSLVKYWAISSSGLSAINAGMAFGFNAGEVIGSLSLYEPRVWDGVSLSTVAGASLAGSNPFSTSGSTVISGDWTAIDPTVRNAFYSYVSGDWNTASTWTTDPSGTTLINSAVPSSGDQVYILNGRTITNVTPSITIASLTIESGAILDMGTTSGHNFGPVSGTGLYRQSGVTLPVANFSSFVASTGGTFEYYDLPAGTNVLDNTLATYNNLIISNSTGTSFALAMDHNVSLNGNLTILRTGAGAATFTIGNSAVSRTFILRGNGTVGAGCTWNVGTFNAIHNTEVFGNLTNSGTILLTNGAIYTTPATGASNIVFRGIVVNTTMTANSGSSTRFYTLTVQKNSTFELLITAAPGASPQFWGPGNTIEPIRGTLRLGSNVVVGRLTGGGNYDLGTSTEIPTLWVDGATVTYGGGSAIVPYGTLRVSSGTLNVEGTGQGGIVLRETGQLIIEGGTVNAWMFRTSTTATSHRGSFSQSGGTFNLTGAGGGITHYAIFSLPYDDNVFQMSGGTINITRAFVGGITVHGGIMIGSTLGNYNVTGGTINVTITPSAAYNFDISSRAPLYNLNISRNAGVGGQARLNSIPWSYDGSGANTVTFPTYPLVVLNDFTINGANAPVFNAQNSNVTVRNQMTVNNGGTFQTGTQTLSFDGAGAQTFTVSGSLSTGLSTLSIDKSASTLTIAGTVGTITVRDDLNLVSGTIADGGKTINVAGDISNNGTHSGAGKIAMNGTTAQLLTGSSTGIFGNLDFSNTAGVAGSTQITLSSNIQVNGNLGLTTDRVTAIGTRTIILSATSSITGTFSNNRHIKTSGLLSDGGIRKTFNSTSAFTFPLGYGTNYAPATIQFTSAPTTWGSLDVRPVGTKQLYVTDPDCFDLYWKVKTTGFTGVPANSVNYTFNYGNLTDNVAYIPAFYDQLAIAFVQINDVTQVNEGTNNISFTGVSYTDGDYTAGIPAAFGTVIPYYSRADGNWNDPTTWSNSGFGGAAAATIPSSNSPVLIGDGSLFNHTVTVTTNNTISGSLIVDAGSTLDCQTTTSNNFGAIPYATAGGSGRIRISSAAATAEFPAGDFGLFFEIAGGTAEFYSTGIQDFTLPTATAAPTAINIDTYRNLVIAPGAGRTISFPDKNIRIYEDLSIDGNASGIAQFAPSTSRTLTIDDDLVLTAGILEIGSPVAHLINVKDNVRVETNGTLRTQNSGTTLHSLVLEGSIFNEGAIDLNNASSATLSIIGPTSEVWNGSNAGATVDLAQLTINKGTSLSTELDITSLGTWTAPSNNWLNLTNGNLKISKSGSFTLTNAANDFIIPQTSALTLNNAGLTVNVGMVNSANADLVLIGKLSVLAGTLNIGDVANNQNNDLEYSSAGVPEVEVLGSGIMNINGQVRRNVNVQLGSLKYTQADNAQVLVRGRNSDPGTSLTYDRAKFEILNPGSEFNMSGNSLLTIDRRGTASLLFGDIFLEPASFNITGGEIRVGTSSTLAGQNFITSSTASPWNFSIDGTTNAKTVTLTGDPIVFQNNLTIEGNSIFNTSGLDVTIGGNLVNQNSNAASGLTNGGYQAAVATQITTFNSSTANQSITGSGANLTNFAVLNLQNTFPSGQVSLGSNSNIRVAGLLTIGTCQFNSGTNTATCLANVVNNGGHLSSGAGFLVMAGASSQAISSSGTASFGSLRVNNSAGVNAECPSSVSGTLNLQNGNFYINNHLLSLGATASVIGTFSSATMIRTNGVTSDAGVTKAYPASASDFTFPVGVTLRYTPARFNVTSNTVAGTVNLKPVAIKHPATTDVLDLELGYYWRVASTGFNGATTVNHTYNYQNGDVNGTETSYVTGRFLTSLWAPTFGIPGTVDPTNDRFTLTGVNYFNGDYTAGEPSEFNILATFYSRTATLGGNWDDPNSWSTDDILQHGGPAAVTFPNFNQVVIAAGHTVVANGNNRNAVSLVLSGTLNLGNNIGHNMGNVSGTGRVIQTATGANQYVFPGGDFSSFTNTGGGTFEFGGAINGTLSTQAVYNNLEFSGTATKSLPNVNISVNGDLTLTAGLVNNPANRNISLTGNWINAVGIGGFSGGTGSVILTGGTQNLSGATNFGVLATNSPGNKTLSSSMSATAGLTLTDGLFVTGANNLTVDASATITGGSSTSYVNGNLRRGVPAAATTLNWPIGDATAYTPVSVSFTGSTTPGGHILANTTAGDHPQVYTSGVNELKSANRYWTLTNTGVGGFTGYNATVNFTAGDFDGSANPLNFIISRYSSGSWTQPTVGTVTSTSTQGISISGTVFGDFQVGQSIGGKIWTGTTNTNWNIATNWLPVNPPNASENAIIGNVPNQPTFLTGGNGFCRDLVVLSGATVTIPSGYTLNVDRDIQVISNTIDGIGTLNLTGPSGVLSGTLTANCNIIIDPAASFSLDPASSLSIGRDLTINGSLNPGTLPVTFVGPNNATISGTNASFYDLVINKSNSSVFVALGGDVSVTNEVDLQTGDIDLNGNDLDLGTTGSLVNETDANRITGVSGGTIRTVRTLNAPSSVNVGGLGAVISSASNLGSTEIIRKHNQVVFGIEYGTNRRYEIHPTNNTALNATLVFNYFDDELVTGSGTILEGELVLWRFNGTIWEAQTGTLNTLANTITKTAIPQFSEWTTGSEVNNPLPVDVAFTQVECDGHSPDLIWRTLRETDSRIFKVQFSLDGKVWENLGSMAAAGQSQSSRDYMFSLKGLPLGVRQVRLVLVDALQQETIFPALYVSCGTVAKNVRNFSVFPNPGDGAYTLSLNEIRQEILDLKVINILGQIVSGGVYNASRTGKISLDLRGLPAGLYKLQVTSDVDGPVVAPINLVIR
jgi:hypothetical protein